MRKLSLLTLAAGAALVPTLALAQPRHPGPQPGMHRPPVGHSFRHPGTNVRVRHHGPNVVVRHHGGGNVVVRHHPGRNFHHRRLQRGFFIHPFWFGPQFHIQNWQHYGFVAPPRDHRWIRYYDDAYLIDRRGQVMDRREGLDWDEYGERWEMDDGIPSYYGRGDYHPDEEDYDWVESQGGPAGPDDWDYAEEGGPHPGYGPPAACRPGPEPCAAPAHPYYGYGYGYGVVYPPIIIETTVTTGGACCQQTVERVVERRRHHQQRSKLRRHHRPAPGERG